MWKKTESNSALSSNLFGVPSSSNFGKNKPTGLFGKDQTSSMHRGSTRANLNISKVLKKQPGYVADLPLGVHRSTSWPGSSSLSLSSTSTSGQPTHEQPSSPVAPTSSQPSQLRTPGNTISLSVPATVIDLVDNLDVQLGLENASVVLENASVVFTQTSISTGCEICKTHVPRCRKLRPSRAEQTLSVIDSPIQTMCFALHQGRVTSLNITQDGCYCVAGFACGEVRLFDLTANGNTDPEDKWGYLLFCLASVHHKGSVALHTELGGRLRLCSESSVTTCSHLFIGIKGQGASTMAVVDLRSVRAWKYTRGFITSAGAGVHPVEYTDARLRGFCALHTEYVEDRLVRSSEGEDVYVGCTARYLALTGKGMSQYYVWRVTVHTTQWKEGDDDSLVIETNQGTKLTCTSEWHLIVNAAVNSPRLEFALFVTMMRPDCAPPVVQLGEEEEAMSVPPLAVWPAGSAGRGSDVLQLTTRHGRDEAGLVSVIYLAPVARECLIRGDDKNIKVHALVTNVTGGDQLSTARKPTIDSSKSVYCGNDDGSVLFSAEEQLIVHKFVPGCSQFARSFKFSLLGSASHWTPTSSSSSSSASSAVLVSSSSSAVSSDACNMLEQMHKKSRHLRTITHISCTTDGSYALIQCSDNAVFLYSPCDLYGCGIIPEDQFTEACEGSMESGGYLTLLFVADRDCFSLFTAIHAAVIPCDQLLNQQQHQQHQQQWCDCGLQGPAGGRHCRPSDVVVTVAYWLTADPSLPAVLRTTRLMPSCCTDSNVSSTVHPALPIFPFDLSSGIDVLDHTKCCSVCHDPTELHWPSIQHAASLSSSSSTTKKIKSESARPKHEPSIDHTRKHLPLQQQQQQQQKRVRPAAVSTKTSSQLTSSQCDSSMNAPDDGDMANEDNNIDSNRTIESLRAEIVRLQSELETVMRKADRRFNCEMEMRRNWKKETESFQEARTQHVMESSRNTAEISRLETQIKELSALATNLTLPLMQLLKCAGMSNESLENLGNSSSCSSNSSSSGSSSGSGSGSGNDKDIMMRAPFCVACQAHTADVVVLQCGHVCLCYEHALHMTNSGNLVYCPVCKARCEGICRIAGLNS